MSVTSVKPQKISCIAFHKGFCIYLAVVQKCLYFTKEKEKGTGVLTTKYNTIDHLNQRLHIL